MIVQRIWFPAPEKGVALKDNNIQIFTRFLSCFSQNAESKKFFQVFSEGRDIDQLPCYSTKIKNLCKVGNIFLLIFVTLRNQLKMQFLSKIKEAIEHSENRIIA